MSPVDMGFLFAYIAIVKSTTRLILSVGSSMAYSLPQVCVCSLALLRRRCL